MQLGIFSFNTEYGIRPDEFAVALEERGYESFWLPEHTHIPASRLSPYPGGGDLPRPYYHMADPFVSAMAAAAATRRLIVGTAICLVVEHDPIVLAKKVATLDWLSGGRFILGVGAGWNAEEMENHGTAFDTRWKLMRERIEAMKTIWADDPAEYHGEFVDFDPIFSKPKPVQAPHPPIHVGGASPWGPRRAARYGDGWMPINGRGGTIMDDLPVLAEECEKNGRDIAEIELSLYMAPVNADVAKEHEEGGVSRFIFGLPPADAETLLPMLDKQAEVIAAVNG